MNKKYEYTIKYHVDPNYIESNLNTWGLDGWECFQIIKEYNDYKGTQYTVFLKREINE